MRVYPEASNFLCAQVKLSSAKKRCVEEKDDQVFSDQSVREEQPAYTHRVENNQKK